MKKGRGMRRWIHAGGALVMAGCLGLASGTPAHAGPLTGVLYNIRFSSDGSWQGWAPAPEPPGTPVGAPVVTADAGTGTTHVTVLTTDGLYDTQFYGDGWQAWEPTPQPPDLNTSTDVPGGEGVLQAQVYGTGEPDGSIDFYQVEPDGRIYTSVRAASGSWSQWRYSGESIAQPGDLQSIAVASVPYGDGGHADEFIESTTNRVIFHDVFYDNTYSGNGWWQDWQEPQQPNGNTGALTVAAAGLPNGNCEFMIVTSFGIVLHTIRYANGTWQQNPAWGMPHQPLWSWAVTDRVNLSAAADYDGNAQFVLWYNPLGQDTIAFHTIRDANGTWQTGWGEPEMTGDSCDGGAAIPTYNSGNTNLYLDTVCW
jgi:hypothetical protein